MAMGGSNAQDQVQGPAISMLIVGGLNALGGLGLMCYGIAAMTVLSQAIASDPNMTKMAKGDAQAASNLVALGGGVYLVAGFVGLIVSAAIVLGALKMRKLESYGMAMTTSILAMIPCISPCCIAGLPLGIWSLMVLNKPEVKGAFH